MNDKQIANSVPKCCSAARARNGHHQHGYLAAIRIAHDPRRFGPWVHSSEFNCARQIKCDKKCTLLNDSSLTVVIDENDKPTVTPIEGAVTLDDIQERD